MNTKSIPPLEIHLKLFISVNFEIEEIPNVLLLGE